MVKDGLIGMNGELEHDKCIMLRWSKVLGSRVEGGIELWCVGGTRYTRWPRMELVK